MSRVRIGAPDATGIASLIIDREDDRVNALDLAFITELHDALTLIRSSLAAGVAPVERPGRPFGVVRGLVVLSAKDGQWVSGADLALLRTATGAQLAEAARSLHDVLAELGALPIPVVAAINGAALGGGLELALACDRRIAADSPAVQLGLPETQLGLIPAGGGCQRLPRLIGLSRALPLILTGRSLDARGALRMGIVDDVVDPYRLEEAARALARSSPSSPVVRRLSLGARLVTFCPPVRKIVLALARRAVRKASRGHYPASTAALEAVEAGLREGMAAGLVREAALFGELAAGSVARNLTELVIATAAQRRAALTGLPQPTPVRRVLVVGAGFMGAGIAQAAAVAGMTARVRDVGDEAVARGLWTAQKLTLEAARKRVFSPRETARISGRLSGATDLSGARHADLVIEAVFEDLEVKRRVVAELDACLPAEAVIASNTSALPISEIARGSAHPERVVGMHFFSPVHKMPLLEIVRPDIADPHAVATAICAGQAMGKTVIVVSDRPGFYTTRVLGTMLAEALRLLGEGAQIDEVDRRMTAYGWPVGPFALMDEVGLPVVLHAGITVARAQGIEMPLALEALVAKGFQGKRGQSGFYLYEGGQRHVNAGAYAAAGYPYPRETPDAAERLTAAFVNEAHRCLDEGVISSERDGDLGAVLGLGFPPFLGGPFARAS